MFINPPGYNYMNYAKLFCVNVCLFENANGIDIVLTALQKIVKNTRGRLQLLTSAQSGFLDTG